MLLGARGDGDLRGSSALMMEILAIRQALSACVQLQLTDVMIESDAQ